MPKINPFYDIVLPFNDTMYWIENLEARIKEYKATLDEALNDDIKIDPFEVTVKLSGFLTRLKHIEEDMNKLRPHLDVPDEIKHHLT